MNVNCVTVYAFALDNFHRPAEEVDALMVLAADKLVEMCKHGYVDSAHGSCIPFSYREIETFSLNTESV